MRTKWIIVTGGVLSGLGKGIVTASIGRFFVPRYKIVTIKCDGYLNVDPGTMNPIEHGEVFVLEDGGEVDMDFGHYERFLDINCKFRWNLTSGKIFKAVIDRERKGEYLGTTVRMIPHVTDEIKKVFFEIAAHEAADIMLIEIGGTVGDIENELFIEAVRQLKTDVGEPNIAYIHLTYVPVIDVVGEQKSKPTQQSVDLLRQRGIQPDIIIGRSKAKLTDKIKAKIALFANLKQEQIISDPDMATVYSLPLIFEEEGLPAILGTKLGLAGLSGNLADWRKIVKAIVAPSREINIAICGKYTELADSYVSIMEALCHAGAHVRCRVNIKQIETTDIENGRTKVADALTGIDGVIVPGGFGVRGAEGKIAAIKFARENNIPFLGLCFGMQLAVIEFARNVCGLRGANSTEIDPATPHPVIDLLPEQKAVKELGGTMRLGAYKATLSPGSLARQLYRTETILERHRHRYEVNPEYHTRLQEGGLVLSGLSPDRRFVEFIEISGHKFFIATQAHPEFKSRLERPAPLFLGFVNACLR